MLSPHGHVEHHLLVADDGSTTWLDLEPGTGAALLTFLERMRFMLRVEPADTTDAWALLSLVGPEVPTALAALPLPSGAPAARSASENASLRATSTSAPRSPICWARL